ncbi:MAG: hypothetical protein ABSB60_13195 [Terracidiphilus sp.]
MADAHLIEAGDIFLSGKWEDFPVWEIFSLRRPLRPTREILESLRATLQNLEQEQMDGPAEAPKPIAELKRVVVNRIADLELSQMLETADAPANRATDTADLVPPPSIIEGGHSDGLTEDAKLDKID